MAGGRFVFADVDPQTYTLAPRGLEERLTPRTKAILPVHLFGHPADLGALSALARGRGLRLLEDAAQAHGARLLRDHGRKDRYEHVLEGPIAVLTPSRPLSFG